MIRNNFHIHSIRIIESGLSSSVTYSSSTFMKNMLIILIPIPTMYLTILPYIIMELIQTYEALDSPFLIKLSIAVKFKYHSHPTTMQRWR